MFRTPLSPRSLLSSGLAVLLVSCSSWTGEVIESQYQFPIAPDPVYSFKRQGQSSVNMLEAERAQSASSVLYARFLRTSYIRSDKSWAELNNLFQNGGNNEIALAPLLSSSPRFESEHSLIVQDFSQIFEDVRRAGGYLDGMYPIERYNRPASISSSGFIGYGIGDEDRVYALDNGLVPSEQYRGMVVGAIFIDKILNEYLSTDELTDKVLIRQHEDQVLVSGRNYTILEHHWDLAYGYYRQIQKTIQSNSLINGSETELENAFALGRLAITEYRYKEAIGHIHTIRRLLSQAVAARAIKELIGVNTMANLRENRASAFRFISRGLGFVYSLQYTRREDGSAYLDRSQTQDLVKPIVQDSEGLWSNDLENKLHKLTTVLQKTYNLNP